MPLFSIPGRISEDVPLGKRVVIPVRENQVVHKVYIKKHKGILEGFCPLNVIAAGPGIATGMVVGHYYSGCVCNQCGLHYSLDVEYARPYTSQRDVLNADTVVGRIEGGDPAFLVVRNTATLPAVSTSISSSLASPRRSFADRSSSTQIPRMFSFSFFTVI